MSENRGLRYRATSALGKGLIRLIEFPISLTVPDRVIFDKSDFKWLESVESAWPSIKDEYLRIAACPDKLPDIRDVSAEQKAVIAPGHWTLFPLRFYDIDLHEEQSLCPDTSGIVRLIPGCTTAFFSVLKPGAYIKPHRGAFKGYLRMHLGVVVPEGVDKCGLKIGPDTFRWEEGRCLVFDDTFMHDAFNYADSERVVLYVDFIRPMPKLLRILVKGLTFLISQSQYVQNSLTKLRNQASSQHPR